MAGWGDVGNSWIMARSTTLTYLVIILVFFGLIMVGNASVVDAFRDFGNKWYYLKLQSAWAGLGLVSFFIISRINYQKLESIARPMLIVCIAFLCLVLLPGVGVRLLGARRWINLGPFGFQPSELIKFGLVVYWARLLMQKEWLKTFLVTLVGVVGLVMLQPDMGTTIIIVGIAAIMYFGAGGKILPMLGMGIALGLGFLLLVLVSPYRLARIETFLNYNADPQGSSYHIRQVLLSVGSGGVWGVGLGQSRQKYEFLPEVTTDSIFAVVAEETGLVGGLILISMYASLIFLGLSVYARAKNHFGKNLALGVTAWLGMQIVINLGAMTALLPLTGVPLPFISYGGSALVINLLASGLLVGVARSEER